MRLASTRPVDLYAVAALTLLTNLVVFVAPWPPLRVPLGLAFVLFLPGYALVAALFPERPREIASADAGGEPVTKGIGTLERVALSLGLSIAVVPLLGLILNYTPWGIRLVPIILTVSAFTLLMAGIAHLRRQKLPELQRLRFEIDLTPPDWRTYSPLDKALTAALVVAVLVAGGALAYVATTPRAGETFTEFYILGPGGKAEEYPTSLTAGEEAALIVGVVNHEQATTKYTVLVQFVRGHHETNETGVQTWVANETVPVAAWDVRLEHEEKREERFVFEAPAETGTYRMELLLQREGLPEPYRQLHLWIQVADGA